MITILTFVIALICVLLIGTVLIQNPKGGGIDSTFGGNNSNPIIGAAKTSKYVEKLTWGLALTLFILCIFSATL